MNIIAEVYSPPSEPGFNDRIAVLDNGQIKWHGPARCSPNPYRPSDKSPWYAVYGFAADGSWDYECNDWSPKHGKSISINGGGIIPARAPNVNHEWRRECSSIRIHAAQQTGWPGSAGCLTIPFDSWGGFIDTFQVGDQGRVSIITMCNPAGFNPEWWWA